MTLCSQTPLCNVKDVECAGLRRQRVSPRRHSAEPKHLVVVWLCHWNSNFCSPPHASACARGTIRNGFTLEPSATVSLWKKTSSERPAFPQGRIVTSRHDATPLFQDDCTLIGVLSGTQTCPACSKCTTGGHRRSPGTA